MPASRKRSASPAPSARSGARRRRGSAPLALTELEAFYARPAAEIAADRGRARAHASLLVHLERGDLRAASRGADGRWLANAWVKQAILAGFRSSPVVDFPGPGFACRDKSAFPPRALTAADGVRLVPAGSTIRRGAHLAPGVVVMSPAYVNVGAWVGAGTMIDSHALVGSCAQVGAGVHLSAGVQVGGVLEPAGARPVVIEDEAFVGALCAVLEGVVVRRRAVLAAGVILTASTTIYDLVREQSYRGEIPEGAVVVPGSRKAAGRFAAAHGLELAAAVVVKYRDARTDAATALELALR